MESEAGYLLAVLGEGGTYRTTFRVEILVQKFKKQPRNSKMKSKSQKIFGECIFIQCSSSPTARGRGRHVLAVALIRMRGGGGMCKTTADYTNDSISSLSKQQSYLLGRLGQDFCKSKSTLPCRHSSYFAWLQTPPASVHVVFVEFNVIGVGFALLEKQHSILVDSLV